MGPPGQLYHTTSLSVDGGRRSKLEGTSAATAVMAHSKLSTEAGMAAASQAATQAKQRAQQKELDELCAAALTLPQHRTQAQIEVLCNFLASAHLLHNLQPTNIKDLAQTMVGKECATGELIYKQGDAAKHFYVVLTGEVVMLETDSSSVSSIVPAHHDDMHSSVAGVSGTKSPVSRSGSGALAAHHSASSLSRSGASPRARTTGGGNSATATPSDIVEVRKVGRREAFGEDDIQAGSKREQTAVAGAITSSTIAALTAANTAANASVHSGGGCNDVAGAAASSSTNTKTRALLDVRRRTMNRDGVSSAASAVPGLATVLLQLSADDYGAVLEGRLSHLLEQKVTFLSELPALKGLSSTYLRSLSHCFHQVQFDPREVLVKQGDISDCLYVLKSGQVCILIDPTLTLADSSPTGAGDDTPSSSEVDTKKLVQVCLLGSGSIIGDMSVRDGPGGPPRRSATVVALTELITYKVPLKEFKRRMPADVLEGMRHVASQKLVMNETQASSRAQAAAAGKFGHIMLGGNAVPEAVLRGKGLRALMDAEKQAAGLVPVGGLLDALDMYFGTGTTTSAPAKCVPLSKAAAVEEYVVSLSRNGFITAPPQEFLALLTDWRTPREATNVSPEDRKVPMARQFPLPISKDATGSSGDHHAQIGADGGYITLPTSSSNAVHATTSTIPQPKSPLSGGAHMQLGSTVGVWGRTPVLIAPVIEVATHMAQSNMHGNIPACDNCGAVPIGCLQATPQQGSTSAGCARRAAAQCSTALASPVRGESAACMSPLTGSVRHLGKPEISISSVQAFRHTLDQLVQLKQGGKCNAGNVNKGKSQAAAIVREAAMQLSVSGNTAGGAGMVQPSIGPTMGGGFKGNLQKTTYSAKPLSNQAPCSAAACEEQVPTSARSAGCCSDCSNKEPTLHEAGIKASMFFRPGSPISINNGRPKTPLESVSTAASAADNLSRSKSTPASDDSSRQKSPRYPAQSATAVPVDSETAAAVSKTMAVLDSFGSNINAAVVLNHKGVPQLDFHTTGAGILPPAQPGKVA